MPSFFSWLLGKKNQPKKEEVVVVDEAKIVDSETEMTGKPVQTAEEHSGKEVNP